MIRLVTDSTSDILPDEARRLGVDVVPLTVRFGDEQFFDGVEMSPDAFYSRLPTTPVQPKTSQPTPEQFSEVFRRHVGGGDTVVSIHISAQLSGTLQSATLAAAEFPAGAVHVIDSQSVSAGIQFLVRDGLRDIAEGCSAAEVAERTLRRRSRVGVYVLLDTLTYLQRGGRIGRAQGFVGGILKVKPLLRVAEEVHPEARLRSRQQGIARMVEIVQAQGAVDYVAAFHCGAPDALELLVTALADIHPAMGMFTGELGAVVGTYSGPGGVGVAFLRSE